mgnify:CR=1 FL=1
MPGWEIIGKDEKNSVIKLFNEGGVLFAHGFDKFRKKYHVREFEKLAAKKFKIKNALAVTSGTAALKIALLSIGVKRGDEVITQAFNFIATIEAILDIGAKPIMVDVDKTLNMSINSLKKSITSKTKAIIPVHMLGVPAKMYEIMKIAKKKKIKVIEDNCEAMGGKLNKKYLCSIGDIGVVSFDFSKTITCGEGGMIYTNDNKLMKFMREYHDHGHENNPKLPRGMDTRSIFGFNYRMTELQAVVGKVQLKKINQILKMQEKRYKVLYLYSKKKEQMRAIPKNSQITYDTFIYFEEDKKKRNIAIKILNKYGFGTKNLPDAIKWHCASFWDHALEKKQINKINKTKKLLSTAIAVPISLKRSVKDYKNLGKVLSKI